MAARNYVWIPNWEGSDDNPEGFQHYKNRDPIWIKNYTRLLSKDEYLELSAHRRGVLHGIWLAYAMSRRRLPHDTRSLSSRLLVRVTTADLEALNHAGFIEVIASDVLAERLQDASPHARPRARGDLEVEEEESHSLVARGQAENGAAPPLTDDDIPFDIPDVLVKPMPK